MNVGVHVSFHIRGFVIFEYIQEWNFWVIALPW